MIRPTLAFDEVKFFIEKVKGGDANDNAYPTALIDTFVNKIYLYNGDEGRIDIYYNVQDTKITIPLDKPEGSPKGILVPVAGLEPARCRHRWILSPLRLPIPSHRQISVKIIIHKSSVVGKGNYANSFKAFWARE